MDELIIFWHHVGREHGPDGYAPDLRRNPADLIERTLSAGRQRATSASDRRFLRIDEDTLLEVGERVGDPYFICYAGSEGLQFSLNHKDSHPGWLIDVVGVEQMGDGVCCVHDLFVDIQVDESGAYRILDLEDLARAAELGIVDGSQLGGALRSLGRALRMLGAGRFPPEWLTDLVQEHAPRLLDRT